MNGPVFVYMDEDDLERVVVVRRLPAVIGRSATCDVRIERDTVSPRHARLEMGPDGLRLVDLESLNGLYVNGRRQHEVAVEDGVTVRCGDVRLELRTDERLAPTTRLAGGAPAARSPARRLLTIGVQVAACYAALLAVMAFKQFARYWPPERSVDLFSKSLFIWLMVLLAALFLSLFSKMQNQRYRFVRFTAVLTILVVAVNVFAELIDTVVYNARLAPLRVALQHVGFLVIIGYGLWGMITTIYPRWRSRRHLLTAIVIAVFIDAGLSGYDYYEYREGDRQEHDDQVGLPLLPSSTAARPTAHLHERLDLSLGVVDGYRRLRQAELKAEDGPAVTDETN